MSGRKSIHTGLRMMVGVVAVAVVATRLMAQSPDPGQRAVDRDLAGNSSHDERMEEAVLINNERLKPSMHTRTVLLPEARSGAEHLFQAEEDQRRFIDAFVRGYCSGMENLPGTRTVGKPGSPHRTGFEAGLQQFRHLSSTTNQPFGLIDFGYSPVIEQGTYQWAFEKSDFRPERTNENWWVSFQVDVVEDFLEKNLIRDRSLFSVRRSCTFKGYLAPDRIGFAGHMGQYDRTFIVTEMIHADFLPLSPEEHETVGSPERGLARP